MSYDHRKKNPSADSIAKRTNFQNDHVVTYEKYQLPDSDRSLTSWERGELREFCETNGIAYPDDPNFQHFFRIVGRGPEYQDSAGNWVKPEQGKII